MEQVVKPESRGERLLTIQDVADRLGISKSTAYDTIVVRGEIPVVRWRKRVVRVTEGDLSEFISRHRSETN